MNSIARVVSSSGIATPIVSIRDSVQHETIVMNGCDNTRQQS
jgi:hypothetical protein